MAKPVYDTVSILAEIPAEDSKKLPVRIRLVRAPSGDFLVDIRRYRPAASVEKQDFYLSGITLPVSNIETIAEVINLVADAVSNKTTSI